MPDPIQFIQGSARRIPLASGSIHCAVCSPPFYGLRAYGTEPQVWGGDELCRHEWGEWNERHDVREEPVSGKSRTTDRCYGDASRRFDGNHQKHTAGQTCAKCGAWRGELGQEPDPRLFVAHLVEVFREVKRILRDDGTLWVEIGDSYTSGGRRTRNPGQSKNHPAFKEWSAGRAETPAGMKPKDRIGVPEMFALAMRDDGWYWRDSIIWARANPMPSSVRDRTTASHSNVYLFSKRPRYYFDIDAIREPCVNPEGGNCIGSVAKAGMTRTADGGHARLDDGSMVQSRRLDPDARRRYAEQGRQPRSVWNVNTHPYKGAHFATWPLKLVSRMIAAGTSEKGVCPQCGAPWRRVVERVSNSVPPADRTCAGRPSHNGTPPQQSGWYWTPATTISSVWLPSCKCPAHEPQPALVLDAFSGAGTTGLACHKLGRRYVGIELKAEYIEMSRKRLVAFRTRAKERRERVRPDAPGQLALFGASA